MGALFIAINQNILQIKPNLLNFAFMYKLLPSLFKSCASLVGSQMLDVMAKMRKTMPPMMVTVRTEIFVAIKRPPMTARPVQMACPRTPPMMTPQRFSLAARTIVVICERSPHSATKVMVKACTKI